MGESLQQKEKTRLFFAWASVALIVTGICSLVCIGAAFGYRKVYDTQMFPGVEVAHVRLGGLTKSESRQALQDKIDVALSRGIHFTFKGKEIVLDATSAFTNPDTAHDVLHYDIDQSIDQAFMIGRGPIQLQNVFAQLIARVHARNVPLTVSVDRMSIEAGLQMALKDMLVPVHDAALHITPTDPPQITVLHEQEGIGLIVDPALDELEHRAANLDFRSIALSERRIVPNVTAKDIEPLRTQAISFLERPLPTFIYENKKLNPNVAMMATWASVTGTKGDWSIGIDAEAFHKGLKSLAKDIAQESKNGSLVVKDGKVMSFISGTEGRELQLNAQYAQFVSLWPATTTFPLLVKVVQGSLMGEDPEHLGIKELLGTGRSNFSGSPKNRRLNIALGVKKVSGTLIPPGGEFSMINTLGKIDEENGWLPELVIKGDTTEPEFGGGLCQIGTTGFRGALASGMPIVERRNHSYRVRYYEPAGTDATIYVPKPDFRFKNDTSAYVLISGRIEKENVIFDFWGTKDGRVATSTYPKISDIVPPPPMKLVETLELPPGKKKCTEIAHAGAKAEFTYTVTYPDGQEKKQVFHSHYRPWQAVCLIGVEKLTATSTSAEPVPLTP